MRRLALLAIIVVITCSAWTADVTEHPLIRPFPGSVLAENLSSYKRFDAYEFRIKNPETGKNERKEVRGEFRRLLYEVRNPDGSRVKDISKLEFFENYKAAAEEQGGQVLYEDSAFVTFTLPREDGGITYCEVTGNAGLGQQDLRIIDEKPLKTSLVFGPAQMKAALDKDGRVRLYDILFDLDKAVLKPESTKQLQHVLTLLQSDETLAIEVQGHTDNQGSDEYNLDLSQRRAETVVTYLTLFGIASERLTPKGYGESAPVASNDTEDGRAKNRRVELVKREPAPGGGEAESNKSVADKPGAAALGDVRSYRAVIEMNGLSSTGGADTKMSGTGTVEAMRKSDGTVYRVEMEQTIEMGGQAMTHPLLTIFDGNDVFVETNMMGQQTVMKLAPDRPSTVIVSDKEEMLAKMKDAYDMKPLPDETVNGQLASVYEVIPKQPQATRQEAGPPFTKGRIFFAKDTNLPLRWIMLDGSDKPIMTIDYDEYEINPELDPERFAYTPPAGVTVMDMSARHSAM